MMREYVRLVRQWGRGVPVCIDSGSDDVLIAGSRNGTTPTKPVRPPLINSIKTYTMDKILPLKKDHDFSVIALLVSEEAPTGPGGSYSVDQLMGLAHTMFDAAVGQYGFRPDQIFFDSTVFPLAIDMPMEPGVPGYTYRAFETIKRIRATPKFKGVHLLAGHQQQRAGPAGPQDRRVPGLRGQGHGVRPGRRHRQRQPPLRHCAPPTRADGPGGRLRQDGRLP